MKNKKSLLFIALGLILWAGAAGLVGYNLHQQKQGGTASNEVLDQLVPMIPKVEKYIAVGDDEETIELVIPDYVLNPDMEMPTVQIDGRDYIGTLEIPEIGIVLPVISEWSYPALRVSPCRYEGTVYQKNLIIAAHNFNSHFGQLPKLSAGSVLRFTDVDGNEFLYEVVETEIINPTGVEDMLAGDWDLTLFTCTIGGRTRFTVRCLMINEP